MAGVGEWRTEYKEQFKQDFATHLTRLFTLDPTSAIPDHRVHAILHLLTTEALGQGTIYIEEDEDDHPRIYNNELDCLHYIFPDERIGGENCFMQLLREYDHIGDEDLDVRRALDKITAEAVYIGKYASNVFLRMMVIVNVEGREDLMKRFSNAVQMLSFLKEAFEYWPGRNEYFGVVYNRIIALMEHAQTEFRLHEVPKRSRMPKNWLKDIPDLQLKTEDILTFTVQIISRMEFYLSFTILPDGPRLLAVANNGRSLRWLLRELQYLTEGPRMIDELTERVKELMSCYKNHEYHNDIQAFLNRMNIVKRAMWQVVKKSASQGEVRLASQGEVRLHVEAKIIELHQMSALIRIEGINTREAANWYVNKCIAYRYKNKVQKKNTSHDRCIWGKITKPHDDTGILEAKFKSFLVRKRIVRMWVYIGVE